MSAVEVRRVQRQMDAVIAQREEWQTVTACAVFCFVFALALAGFGIGDLSPLWSFIPAAVGLIAASRIGALSRRMNELYDDLARAVDAPTEWQRDAD